MLKEPVNVHVIGAGVIGLSTAVALQMKGYRVTVLAKHFPGDPNNIEYTSPWAGARWQSLATNADKRQQQFDGDTFKLLYKLANGKSDETGIMVVPAYDYYKDPTPDERDPWFKNFVPTVSVFIKFRVLGQDDEMPPGMNFGVHYTTGNVGVVVNCSGLHARTLGGVEDKAVVPTRGQNVIVHASHIRKTISYISPTHDGYVIPRSDGTVILGTTHEEYNMDPTVNQESVKKVLDEACKMCPELIKKSDGTARELSIAGYVTGVRPVRKGGPRVENEIMTSPLGKTILVTHNYGHGSFGHMSAWGSGLYAARLVAEGYSKFQKEKREVISLLSHL
ncbi:hypothetical protein BJV82DRAFT_512735 [Fennellomyces sp. T-0311]|nr:hypothetical protein BJV82DRAFT_512735 [Fennellomyces sp. T-0311]